MIPAHGAASLFVAKKMLLARAQSVSPRFLTVTAHGTYRPRTAAAGRLAERTCASGI